MKAFTLAALVALALSWSWVWWAPRPFCPPADTHPRILMMCRL